MLRVWPHPRPVLAAIGGAWALVAVQAAVGPAESVPSRPVCVIASAVAAVVCLTGAAYPRRALRRVVGDVVTGAALVRAVVWLVAPLHGGPLERSAAPAGLALWALVATVLWSLWSCWVVPFGDDLGRDRRRGDRRGPGSADP